eukprot:1167580-Rhodomonas_salina.1
MNTASSSASFTRHTSMPKHPMPRHTHKDEEEQNHPAPSAPAHEHRTTASSAPHTSSRGSITCPNAAAKPAPSPASTPPLPPLPASPLKSGP